MLGSGPRGREFESPLPDGFAAANVIAVGARQIEDVSPVGAAGRESVWCSCGADRARDPTGGEDVVRAGICARAIQVVDEQLARLNDHDEVVLLRRGSGTKSQDHLGDAAGC